MTERPGCLVVVAGTGTEVGKTWVSARLLDTWRRWGLRASARKPAQSFDPSGGPTDAEILSKASGEDAFTVCSAHRWYGRGLAPPMAARALGLPPLHMRQLVGELTWPAGSCDVGLVETAGGVRSPQGEDGDVTTMISMLGPDAVVLVADAGLGTISSVRLCVSALSEVTDKVTVALNRFDERNEVHSENLRWLLEVDCYRVIALGTDGIDELARASVPKRSGVST